MSRHSSPSLLNHLSGSGAVQPRSSNMATMAVPGPTTLDQRCFAEAMRDKILGQAFLYFSTTVGCFHSNEIHCWTCSVGATMAGSDAGPRQIQIDEVVHERLAVGSAMADAALLNFCTDEGAMPLIPAPHEPCGRAPVRHSVRALRETRHMRPIRLHLARAFLSRALAVDLATLTPAPVS